MPEATTKTTAAQFDKMKTEVVSESDGPWLSNSIVLEAHTHEWLSIAPRKQLRTNSFGVT